MSMLLEEFMAETDLPAKLVVLDVKDYLKINMIEHKLKLNLSSFKINKLIISTLNQKKKKKK